MTDEEVGRVAIVGMAGRFPGADDVDEFWRNLEQGVESISFFGPEELDIVPDASSPDATPTFVAAKGIVEGVDRFDARFFGYLPTEAAVMDPQHRVFLENCWEALEHAGYDPARYEGSVGVYAGCYIDTYLLSNLCTDPVFLRRLIESIQVGTLQTELGNDKDYLATRVAYKLGLRGPALTLQTACSTSLVAIAQAYLSLMTYGCDMALAGGVTLTFPLRRGYFYKEGGMLSRDGHCRAFDAQAAGTVFSNASAVVLLKRLEEAMADGDTIYAVIAGAAINNDGGEKLSYTAPSVEGQAEAIALAHGMADIDPRTVSYIECHGTATPLGDPIEIEGLTAAFRRRTEDRGFCAIGSVKTNLGHLDVASGVTGVIKTALALHHEVLPASLHYERANPKIDFESTPFFVNAERRPWPRGEQHWPRRAGVSSFGVGGTNAHVVLEEAPKARVDVAAAKPIRLLPLSARTETALAAQCKRLADRLEREPHVDLDDVAHTLQVGRQRFAERRVVVAATPAQAVARLRATRVGDAGQATETDPPVVFMFPGQGSQFPNMSRDVYENEPVLRETIDVCAAQLKAHFGFDLLEVMFLAAGAPADATARAAARLKDTTFAQPAIFAVEVALARLWQSWGVKPSVLVGHSVGEFAAATVAGVMPLEVALDIVAARGQLMSEQPRGSMLAIRRRADEVQGLLTEPVQIAAVNSPRLTVVSGPSPAVEALAARLAAREIPASPLHTSHAFHSSMMDPAVAPTVARVAASRARLRA
ncbi:MAG: type I polyketide synthase, partial [Myxococcota bacterium]